MKSIAIAALVMLCQSHAALAEAPEFAITIKDHQFTPSEIKIPADTKVKLVVDNQDKTPEEFESHDFQREKVIPGGSKATISVGPLKAGTYNFIGEFNPKSAQGKIIAGVTMLGTFIVVFRETFEIALILSVILAATRGIAGRAHWAIGGILAGILGAAIIAFFAEIIMNAFDGNGQEVMNAFILLGAAFMIGWTVIWMKTHARELSKKIKSVGQGIRDGNVPLYSLSIVIALAVFREGAEIVLFSYGLLSTGTSILSFATGAALGVLAGATFGILLYLGLITMFTRHFFSVTSWMLTLLAAGMASQGVHFLSIAGYVPELGGPVWDSSAILPEQSWLGETLKVLIGYASQPTGIQLVFYVATVAIIFGLMRFASKPRPAAA